MKSTSILVVLFASLTAAAALSATPATARRTKSSSRPTSESADTTPPRGRRSPATPPAAPYSGVGRSRVSGNDIFAAQNLNDTIGEYTTSGATVNPSFIAPAGLPADAGIVLAVSGGDLFVSDVQAGSILEYDATTGALINPALTSPSLSLWGPGAIAASGDDLYLIASVGGEGPAPSVIEYTTSGATVNPYLVDIAGLSSSSQMAISGGDLFISVGGTIGEYDATTGTAINAALVTGLSDVAGMAVSGGDLFVVEAGNGLPYAGTVGEYDATTGAAINSSLVTGFTGGGGIVVVTPEPSTWVMLAIGAAALHICGVRSRRSQA